MPEEVLTSPQSGVRGRPVKAQKLSGTKRFVFSLIGLFLVLAAIEGGAAVVTGILVRRGWMAQVPRFSEGDISRYLRKRNPLLGWGPPVSSSGKVSELRPRPDPLSTRSNPPCISVYGDSFTYGYGAADAETYPHYLSAMVECPVANHGVDGYGSDQAFMLFRAQEHLDNAPLVILGHLSENILRNVNRYRALLYPGAVFEFKPRFVMSNGRLDYVPIPVNNGRDFRALQAEPDSVLSGDALLTRPRRSFPFTSALLRWSISDFKLRAALSGAPAEASFYDQAHPSGALELTAGVLSSFAREARDHGARGVVLLIPTQQVLTRAAKTGVWVDQPLADALRRQQVPVIHAGPLILQRLAGTNPCSLFAECTEAHFTSVGNKLLASIVAAELGRMHSLHHGADTQ